MLNSLLHGRDHGPALSTPGRFHKAADVRQYNGPGFALSMRCGTKPATASAVALHESGHSVALLASGYNVERVAIWGGEHGVTVPSGPVAPRVMLMVSAAGGLAEDLEGYGRSVGSNVDDEQFRRAAMKLGITSQRELRAVIDASEELLAAHRDEVLFLARRLDEMGTIDKAAFARLCREPGSPLAPYAGRYRILSPRSLHALKIGSDGFSRVVCSAF